MVAMVMMVLRLNGIMVSDGVMLSVVLWLPWCYGCHGNDGNTVAMVYCGVMVAVVLRSPRCYMVAMVLLI